MNAYVALYRKYRSQTFAELVGQEAVARTLTRAIQQQRLGHAYLFCGPRGTGKTSVARILAKSVNCQEGPTPTPCGVCSNCREITSGTNLDVIEIDAASNNGVDNIRDLQDRVALAPVTGRTKVYIIDEVHMLSQGAFNALLKTLEEPPPNVLFVLATTDPHKVLPTIISRCQRFDFGRIPLDAIAGHLAHVAAQEGIQVDRAGIEAIARRANGGLRDALSLLDQIAAMAGGAPVSAEEVARSLGLMSGESVAALGRALLEGDVATALDQANAILAAGYDHGAVLRELMAHFRHLMVLQLVPERAAALDVPASNAEELKAQAAFAGASELPWILEVLNETEGTVRRSPQQAIWLELGLIKLAKRPSIPSFSELIERVAALEAASAQGAPLPPPAARVAPAPAARPVAPAPVAPVAPVPSPAAPRPPAPVPAPAAAAPARPEPRANAVEPAAAPAPVRPAPAPAEAELGLPPRPPLAELPPRPPLPARPEASRAPEVSEVETPRAPSAEGGSRIVPPHAWQQLREEVRRRSVPTAALLEQQAAIDRWEPDGAVVIRIAKAFKDTFDRQAAKKQLLAEAVVAVFGPGAFPRLEAGDPKSLKPAGGSTAPTAAPAPTPAPVPPSRPIEPVRPAPAASVPAPIRPVAPVEPEGELPPWEAPSDDEPPLAEPPDWLDDEPPGDAPGTAAPREALDDTQIKLVSELFNGRVLKGTERDSSR